MAGSISGHSRLLAVVADPVSQARTPAMANAVLRERGLLGAYVLVPMQVPADGFPAFLAGIRGVPMLEAQMDLMLEFMGVA